ncbi:MAG: cupin domain-containing protein [Calditerrivibrio sp.]|nr:cupin domain-containing protein [Calditerrivibrio sp.]
MFVGHLSDVKGVNYETDEIKGVIKQVAIGKKEGWDDYVMRVFTIKNGGNTPRHSHDWCHVNYVIEGEGTLFLDGKEYEVKAGSIAYIPNNKEHQFKANKGSDIKFICIVPEKGEY